MFSKLDLVEPFDIKLGDKSSFRAIGRGEVELFVSVKGKQKNKMYPH
jgi:hypothetical protein